MERTVGERKAGAILLDEERCAGKKMRVILTGKRLGTYPSCRRKSGRDERVFEVERSSWISGVAACRASTLAEMT